MSNETRSQPEAAMKTEAKHTPGPWTVVQRPHSVSVLIGGDEDGDEFKTRLYGGAYLTGDARRIANANLIAAAPELLEALKVAMSMCRCSIKERDSGHLIDCFVPRCEEVIAKAEGK